MTRTAVGREANRRGPAVSSPFPFFSISATAALSSSSSHSPLLAHRVLRLRALRRSSSSAARSCPSPGELTPPLRRTSLRGDPQQRLRRARRIHLPSSTSSPRRRRTSSPAASSPFLQRTSSFVTPPPQVRLDASLPLSSCTLDLGTVEYLFALCFAFLLTRRSSRVGSFGENCFSVDLGIF